MFLMSSSAELAASGAGSDVKCLQGWLGSGLTWPRHLAWGPPPHRTGLGGSSRRGGEAGGASLPTVFTLCMDVSMMKCVLGNVVLIYRRITEECV